MADIQIGSFRGYSDSSTSYGYYLIYFGYDSVVREATSVTFKNARVWGSQQGTGYTTNTIYLDQFAINNINMSTSWNGVGKNNTTWSAGWKDMTVTGIDAGTTSVTAQYWMHRTGQNWGAQSGSGSISISKASLWNDINAFQPDGSTQNGLIFNLSTSDGSSWTNLTNEPSSFTKPYGTTATISNIRSNVTGAHYTSNNVTGNAASSFTWTFTTANWACALYSAWNTYTVTYNGNGATGGSTANSSHTYNTAKALTTNGYTRTGYKFAGWSTSNTATSATYSDGQSVSNLTSTNGGTVTLYAVWTSIAPYSLSLSETSWATTSIGLKLTASSAVTISNYTVYYKLKGATSYSSKSFGTSSAGDITGLSADSNYDIYFTATNSAGTSTSDVIYSSTLMNAPTIIAPVISNLLPFSCTQISTGSITPSRPLEYLFSKDNGSTWVQHKRNLFNITRWKNNGVAVNTGTCTVNDTNFVIKSTSADTYTLTMHWTTSGVIDNSLQARASIFGFPVCPNTTYYLGYNVDSSSVKTQAYVHWYDADFHVISYPGTPSQTSSTRVTASFKSPSNAVYASLRFDLDTNNATATFSNIYFGLDSTATYVAYTSDTAVYDWTGLSEETNYNFCTKVWALSTARRAHSTYKTSSSTPATTPADQAKIRIKKDGSWVKGKTYFKKDGQWVKAKKVYIKVNGEWKINNNYDS